MRILTIDDAGVTLLALTDRPVDVQIDGRRIWTFWTLRDTDRVRIPPLRRAPWPRPLSRYLDGRAQITILDSATGEVHLDREIGFGAGDGPIEVVNAQGVELGIDKSGKLVPTFSGRSDADIAALLDAIEAVVAALQGVGLEPFLAYGTLLGAVREGRVLGHDSDADLGYVSAHSTPVDVARESFAAQRLLAEQGWEIERYSGGAFKLVVQQSDSTIGLDVFGGFLDQGRLYLMGEIGTDFDRDWIYPLGLCELGGRPMPVPARPDKLLEATYGPGWKVPDPAFKFTTDRRTVRALEDWFRGTQPGARYWQRKLGPQADNKLRDSSVLARRAARSAKLLGGQVLDIGAGRGADSLWVAKQGVPVTAYDYVPEGLAKARRRADKRGFDLDVRHLNLAEWRSVLSEGARLARIPGPKVVIARHVLDATSASGREGFGRLCSMAMRDGGRVWAELHVSEDGTPPDEQPEWPEWMVGVPTTESLTSLLTRSGATRVKVTRLAKRSRPTIRVMGEWPRADEGSTSGVEQGGDRAPRAARG